MKTHRVRLGIVLGLLLPVWACAAPGEDPIVLEKKVSVQMQPYNQNTRSGYVQYNLGLAADLQAKISRYTAKAYSADTTGIYTEKDVVQAVKTDGNKVVCSQSVGSNIGTAATATTGSGKPADQIVVLRGDLINICN